MKNYLISMLVGGVSYFLLEWVALRPQPAQLSTRVSGPGTPIDIPEQIVPIRKPEAQWKKTLPPLTYKVMREGGTERAFSGEYWNFKGDGIYECRACKLPLFDSKQKYEPGSGWVDFHTPLRKTRIKQVRSKAQLPNNPSENTDLLVHCARCHGYLGRMFFDGNSLEYPNRYCINSVALQFEKRK